MKSFIAKLNLRPGELRLVVVVASVIVVVLYALFIYPEFKEWTALKNKKTGLDDALQRFKKEIVREAAYRKELASLQEKGERVASEAQSLDLYGIVNSQAALHGITINSYTPGRGPVSSSGKTNAFFEEQTGTLNYLAEETALVGFLYALSSGNSLIRVSSMTLNPDNPARMKLMGNLTLVASYKKAPARPVALAGAPGGSPSPARPTTPGSASKSISAAVAAATKPAATNPPASASWWSKVKNLFSPSKSAKAPAQTNTPPPKAGTPPVKPGTPPARGTAPPFRPPARTNAPPAKR